MTLEQYIEIFNSYPEPIAKPLWVSDYEDTIVHTRGEKPGKIIDTYRPNEPKEVHEYRTAIFEPVTRDPFTKATTNLQRTLSHSSVEIIYPEKVKQYLEGHNFRDMSFLTFIQKFIVKRMIEAANALLVWWPESDSVDEDGRIDDLTRQVTVRPIVVMPNDIHHYDENVLTFLSTEKSMVEIGGEFHPIGQVYYVILKDALYKRKQVKPDGADMWQWVAYYSNPFNEIYALPLGGDEISKVDSETDEEVVYFTSYFSSAIPFANECLRRHSDNQATWVTCSSPIREMEPMPCTNCKNGYVERFNKFDKPMGRELCGTCHGTMQVVPTTSYGIVMRQKPGNNNLGEPIQSTRNTIEFLHPDPAILEYSGKSWQEYLKFCKDSLNLIFTDEAQSGVAKDIDREDKLATMDKIAVHVYRYLATMSVYQIQMFMFPGAEPEPIQINLPITFVVKRESDLTDELKNLRAASAPDVIVGEVARELMYKKYGGDPFRMKVFDVVMMVDPLATKTPNEKRQDLASSAISEQDYQFSTWTYPIVSRFAQETEGFTDMDFSTILARVTPLIEQKVSELTQKAADRLKAISGASQF